ncbi:uncharacterized protein LOC134696612 [Mytilus trossulus]|uniref:uncharacterized protein LOC134696612 n=1 Tax=Mytilus trossulus TaxID=6551 RepID=UPI003003BF0D
MQLKFMLLAVGAVLLCINFVKGSSSDSGDRNDGGRFGGRQNNGGRFGGRQNSGGRFGGRQNIGSSDSSDSSNGGRRGQRPNQCYYQCDYALHKCKNYQCRPLYHSQGYYYYKQCVNDCLFVKEKCYFFCNEYGFYPGDNHQF